jgi:ligand-binding sensor domain-containing protein/two-component sensor histidine kinase
MRNLILIFLIPFYFPVYSQQLAYKQFTVKDGLPGAVVYQALQDRNGFIWFATNQGVSRFDGRHFTNYFKEDGLPENEILKLYLDKYNNVWFISFVGIPSVYHNGAIIRFDSCQNVKAICEDHLTDSILFMATPGVKGHIYQGYYRSPNINGQWRFSKHFKEAIYSNFLHWPFPRASTPDKTSFYFSVIDTGTYKLSIKNHSTVKQHFFKRSEDWILPLLDRASFSLTTNKKGIAFFTSDSVYYADAGMIRPILSCAPYKSMLALDNNISYIFCENDSLVWLCTRNKGLLRITNFLNGCVTTTSFFDNSFCTSIIKDHENGYWITTYGDGVFYLPNLCFYTLSAFRDIANKNVLCIAASGTQNLVAGVTDGNILTINHTDTRCHRIPAWTDKNKNNRVMHLSPYHSNTLLVACDMGVHRLKERRTNKFLTIPSKELQVRPDGLVLVATANAVRLLNPATSSVKVIFPYRATCLTGRYERYYWGTFQGVYEYIDNQVRHLGARYPGLSGYINHLDIAPDSALWVSTHEGIAILKNDHVTQIRKEQGLTGNMCKHVSFDKNTAWVSTDKGISRIDYQWHHNRLQYAISTITEEDGLLTNNVNQTIAAGKYIWAATARGISFFSKNYNSRPVLHPHININKIVSGNDTLTVTDTIMINYRNSKLLVELSGISYRSGNQLHYEYRLKNLDSNWSSITNNLIEFPALPFGQFVFEVRAVDRWGSKSVQPKRIIIINNPPFWKTNWFALLSYLFMAVAVGLGFFVFYRRQQIQREKDYQLRRKMHDLEMMALRAQMNPHFIFNCLTSIQYHIIRSDLRNANNYLHKFSTLIRQTLQHSTASTISLREEIKILELYLELEKLRLGERMDYRVEVQDELKRQNIMIPSMIIQPYVENAIKHGIAPLENRQGALLIRIKRSEGYIECTIEDNGPGIHTLHHEKLAGSDDYTSMGTNITASRIHTINTIHEQKILLRVTDKRESAQPGNGTIVHLSFPIITN